MILCECIQLLALEMRELLCLQVILIYCLYFSPSISIDLLVEIEQNRNMDALQRADIINESLLYISSGIKQEDMHQFALLLQLLLCNIAF